MVVVAHFRCLKLNKQMYLLMLMLMLQISATQITLLQAPRVRSFIQVLDDSLGGHQQLWLTTSRVRFTVTPCQPQPLARALQIALEDKTAHHQHKACEGVQLTAQEPELLKLLLELEGNSQPPLVNLSWWLLDRVSRTFS